jgi:hypothetical protein
MNNIFIDDTITHKDIRFDIINTDNIFIDTLIPYNCKSELPMHKIWIMIDNTKIINKHNSQLYLYISSSNKAKNIIEHCEGIIIEKIKSYYEKLKLDKFESNLINEKELIIKFIVSKNIETKYFDEYNNKTTFENIEKFDVQVVCEIKNIIICNDKINIEWCIVQMKKKVIIDLSKSLFDSSPVEQIIPKKPTILTDMLKEIELKKMPSQIQSTTQPTKPLMLGIPTPAMLNDMLTKLKKIPSPDPVSDEQKKIIDIPKLNHVETKEPISMFDILKKEHNDNKLLKESSDENIDVQSSITIKKKKEKKHKKNKSDSKEKKDKHKKK